MKVLPFSLFAFLIVRAETFSPTYSRSDLIQNLQTSHTVDTLLDRVGKHLASSVDPDGSLASLVLVRLGKILINEDNERREQLHVERISLRKVHRNSFLSVVNSLCTTRDLSDLESLVEGTKACATISRIVTNDLSDSMVDTMNTFWTSRSNDSNLVSNLEPHHLSGLFWSFETFALINSKGSKEIHLPNNLQQAYHDLNLPFQILPGFCRHIQEVSVPVLASQVKFQVDSIRTSSDKVVQERRQTAWEGDEGVEAFQYSGKSMPRADWSPAVMSVRKLLDKELNQYFDCCLLNLYPDGKSAMRYHIDPDQGLLWDYETVVVSVGASRRFAFRRIDASSNEKPHTFVVMHGDVTYMFGNCQEKFQHAVKKADMKTENCARASMVFKRSWELRKETKME